MEVGLGKMCITPSIGTRLIGQPEQLESDGKYTDLYARSLYLKSGDKGVIITSCDLLFLTKEVMDDLREEIAKKTGIPFQQIMIHTTHTHAGPAVTGLFGEKDFDREVCEKIFSGIIGSALQAFQNQKRGHLGVGRGYRCDLAFNRRYRMKDGSVEMHPHKDDPNILEPEGPNDPEVNVLFVKDGHGIPVGAVANFSCHLTSLERSNRKFSADFPGFAEQYLGERFGDKGFILLYLNGPCGNICQVDVESKNTVEVGIRHTKKMGKKFSESVLKAMETGVMLRENVSIETVYREIKIPIRSITGKMRKDALTTLERYKGMDMTAPNVSNYGNETHRDARVISANKLLESDFWKYISAKELVDLFDRYRVNNLVEVPLSVLRVDTVFLVATPAELFVEYSLELKDRFKTKYTHVFVLELVNGWVGYVPTRKAFSPKVGGYEVQLLNSSKLDQGAGDCIVKEIIDMEKKLTRRGERL